MEIDKKRCLTGAVVVFAEAIAIPLSCSFSAINRRSVHIVGIALALLGLVIALTSIKRQPDP